MAKTSKYKGVWFDERSGGKWKAKTEIEGKRETLGTFESEEEAALSYSQSMAAHWLARCYILERDMEYGKKESSQKEEGRC